MLPMLDGTVPLSWLFLRSLRAWRGGAQRPAGAAQRRRHAQKLQCSEVAQAGRDGAAQLVAVEKSARMAWWLSAASGSGAEQQARTDAAAQSGCPGWTGWCRSAGCRRGLCAHGVVALSAQRERRRAAGTYSHCRAVMLPMLDGTVPLSWLSLRPLHAGVEALSIQREGRNAENTHIALSKVRLPRLGGMVPLSWLFSRALRACVRHSASIEGGVMEETRTARRSALSDCLGWMGWCR
jgi:hypothetical protein